MSVCCVFRCSRNQTSHPHLSYYPFPEDELKRKTWLKAIGRCSWNPPDSAAICSYHFENGPESVPTRFDDENTFVAPLERVKSISITDPFQIKMDPVIRSVTPSKKKLDPHMIYIPLVDINTLIVCHLCAGYLISATRIHECHHVFCKSCIVQWILKNPHCPVCNYKIEAPLPLSELICDIVYQEVVYKLLPQLKYNEELRCKEFYLKRTRDKMDDESSQIPKQMVEISLFPLEVKNRTDYVPMSLSTPIIRCQSRVLVSYICGLLRKTIGVPKTHAILLYCKGQLLRLSDTLESAYTNCWKDAKPPMEIRYRAWPI